MGTNNLDGNAVKQTRTPQDGWSRRNFASTRDPGRGPLPSTDEEVQQQKAKKKNRASGERGFMATRDRSDDEETHDTTVVREQ